MARRDNTFLVVAAGLAALAWVLFKPKAGLAANAATGGGVTGSPHQVTGGVEVAPGVIARPGVWAGWGL